MKKTFAVLMLAAMLFSAGCGNTMDGAKKDAQDAAAKVEQTANEAKDKANEAKDAAKDAAKETADAANAKVDEMKQDAAAKVDEAKDAAKDAANKATENATAKIDEMAADAKNAMNATDAMEEAMSGRMVSLGGLMPGSTTIEDVQAMFGEAVDVNGKVMTFVDGLKVTFDDGNKVTTITTTSPSFDSGDGVYVGDADYALNDYCGPADAIRQVSDGVEYEYNSGDKKSVVIYKATNGIISEITCKLK